MQLIKLFFIGCFLTVIKQRYIDLVRIEHLISKWYISTNKWLWFKKDIERYAFNSPLLVFSPTEVLIDEGHKDICWCKIKN